MVYTTRIIIKTHMALEQKPSNYIANQSTIDKKITQSPPANFKVKITVLDIISRHCSH